MTNCVIASDTSPGTTDKRFLHSALEPRGPQRRILGQLGQHAITGMSRSGLRQRPSSGVYRVSAGRHDAGRRDACRSLWRVTLTAPVRFESRRMWLAAYNTNLTPLVTGPVIQLSQRHARSVAADELGLLM
jgi:hypothetical protein